MCVSVDLINIPSIHGDRELAGFDHHNTLCANYSTEHMHSINWMFFESINEQIQGRQRMRWWHSITILSGHESEQTPKDDERQRSLACCRWGCKELDKTEQLNNSCLEFLFRCVTLYFLEMFQSLITLIIYFLSIWLLLQITYAGMDIFP